MKKVFWPISDRSNVYAGWHTDNNNWIECVWTRETYPKVFLSTQIDFPFVNKSVNFVNRSTCFFDLHISYCPQRGQGRPTLDYILYFWTHFKTMHKILSNICQSLVYKRLIGSCDKYGCSGESTGARKPHRVASLPVRAFPRKSTDQTLASVTANRRRDAKRSG